MVAWYLGFCIGYGSFSLCAALVVYTIIPRFARVQAPVTLTWPFLSLLAVVECFSLSLWLSISLPVLAKLVGTNEDWVCSDAWIVAAAIATAVSAIMVRRFRNGAASLRYARIHLWIPLLLLALLGAGCLCQFDRAIAAIYPLQLFFRTPDQAAGIVVDQDGKPISRAGVVFEESEDASIVPIPFRTGMRFVCRRLAMTDDTGAFHLAFKQQRLHLVTIEKDGHVFEPCVTPRFWQRRYSQEERENPIESQFLLYDVATPEKSVVKIASTPEFHFTTDGTDYYVTLSSGKITTSVSGQPDLVFSVKQVGTATWLLTIVAIRGGVWASANEKPYAPSEGYLRGFSSLYGQGYASRYRCQYDFFAKTQGGRNHSRVIADIVKKSQTITFHYVLNPSGSRFLFVPQEVDNFGLHGPPYAEDHVPDNFEYAISGESLPWWRKLPRGIYAILTVADFEAMFENAGKNEQMRRYIASQIYAPISLLDELSRSSISQERWDVAQNPATPRGILARLASGSDEWVKREANEMLGRNLEVRDYLAGKDYSCEDDVD